MPDQKFESMSGSSERPESPFGVQEVEKSPLEASHLAALLPQAVRVSSTEQLGIDVLKQHVLKLL